MTSLPYQPTSQTSKDAALSMEGHSQTQESAVLAYVREHGPCTREQVALGLGIGIQSVTARVGGQRGLLAKGLVSEVLTDNGHTKSGRKARLLVARVSDEGTQQALFSLAVRRDYHR